MKEIKELIEKILLMLVKRKIQNYVISSCLIVFIEIIAILFLVAIIIFALAFSFHYIKEIFFLALNK